MLREVSSGKEGSNKDVIMVDPVEAKRLVARQMERIKVKEKLKRRRQIEAINGAWAMIGLAAGLIIEGQSGKSIPTQKFTRYRGNYRRIYRRKNSAGNSAGNTKIKLDTKIMLPEENSAGNDIPLFSGTTWSDSLLAMLRDLASPSQPQDPRANPAPFPPTPRHCSSRLGVALTPNHHDRTPASSP
ncbi:hypothetical protein PIB30_073427 [Stylosanthes scabra]|uniref:Uncharacterized protein n=1 Tax=Stylosanthes scabra TaxID=79078 RepID=A0ABU6SQE0_9FABA|nr:hypothetical protein [Stylosanthes scabra]